MGAQWILVNLGTPTAPTKEAVREFLAEFLGDPRVVDFPAWLWQPILKGIVLRTRPKKTAAMYQTIWTPEGSPLETGTRALAAALDAHTDDEVKVTHAWRYGGELRVDRVIEAALQQADEVVVLPLFPQRTASTTGTIEVLVAETVARLGAGERVRVAALEPDDPGYIRALADRITDTEQALPGGRADRLVVSFHGIPKRVDRREEGRYSHDCQRTTEALCAALERPPFEVVLAYQSRFGPGEWLEPATANVLAELAGSGDRRLTITTPGFLTPGLETLEELGERGLKTFREAGGEELFLVDPPLQHPAFLQALADSARP